MDYSSDYLMAPPRSAHMTSSQHLGATVQWSTGGGEPYHCNHGLLQQQQQMPDCLDYPNSFSGHHGGETHHSSHGLLQQQQQMQAHCSGYQDLFAPHQDRPHIVSNAHLNHMFEASEDARDAKRSAAPSSGSGGEDVTNSESFIKRPRLDQTAVACVPFKVRKEKLGERITALQQLVSPFGRTDTASVLLEAIGYIKFLQDQVQVLSTPYMKPSAGSSDIHHDSQDFGKMSWSSATLKVKDDNRQDLRSRGLCLVPVSCTLQVANDNGADFWTPAIGGGCR